MTIPNEPPNLFYRGSSMKGTFKPGDRLFIKKIPFQEIRKGDLMVYRRTIDEFSEFVVHRVRSITANGLVTRGDNHFHNDHGLVAENDVIGRVIRFDRNGRLISARNGFRGRMHALFLHHRLFVCKAMKRLLRMPYRILRKSGIVKNFWHPKTQWVFFRTPNGFLIKCIHNNRTVGIHRRGDVHWQFRRPYDLILQTRSH